MANNVYSTIKFVTGDHEAEREFIRIFEFIETYEERSLEFSLICGSEFEEIFTLFDSSFFSLSSK